MKKKVKTLFINKIRKLISKYDKCEYCNEAMNAFLEATGRGERITLIFNPDKNASGYITHWHVGTLDQTKINETFNLNQE